MYMLGRGCTPLPIPHPCPSPTARPLWIYFANKEKVRVWPQEVSGSLLGLRCSQLLTVLMTWFPHHANYLPEAWWPEVTAGPWGDIRFLHLPLVTKGWTSPPNPHSRSQPVCAHQREYMTHSTRSTARDSHAQGWEYQWLCLCVGPNPRQTF